MPTPIPYEVTYRSSHSPRVLHQISTDMSRTSLTPKFEVERPARSRRSLSPIPAEPPSTSKTMYAPPPLTWRSAFQDAKAGICYTKDAFPSSSFLPPPFNREPVHVEPSERVEIIDDVDEYAVRIRVLRTGAVGLIPAWNTEGALERLTRMNTAFNEAATCPVEARTMRRRDSASSVASGSASASDDSTSPAPEDAPLTVTHVHARCVPFATRVRYPDFYGRSSAFSDSDPDSDDSDLDSPSPRTPVDHAHHVHERGRSPWRAGTRPAASTPQVYAAPPSTLEKGAASSTTEAGAQERPGSGSRKSVNFAGTERPSVVFRYPSEDLVGEEDEEWWWHGWEESMEQETEVAPEEILIGATFDIRDTFPLIDDDDQ
ncbi:uncharacterized protein BXZ73DRAFT_103571 [Epithele typhae]|uniref:uncharacterized protein n=1 Tax=Epithele typhae TaxID=378194 RepID=UPI0020073C28|nr:uncharacterized protein BXZ73DRAFT_103571 [Epithele typhae]KAH9924281.1 hypothetical protein BXZ73DRAFT_103571 [Epithele typhae]